MLSSPDWHAGVIGIVAARVVEQTGRPTILLSETDGIAKGSGRSIAAFDLLAGVAACSDRLLSYGGHRAACGLQLRAADVPAFAEALAGYAGERLGEDDFRSVTAVEAVAAGDELTLGLTDELDLFAPHGLGNPRPLLLSTGLRSAPAGSPATGAICSATCVSTASLRRACGSASRRCPSCCPGPATTCRSLTSRTRSTAWSGRRHR